MADKLLQVDASDARHQTVGGCAARLQMQARARAAVVGAIILFVLAQVGLRGVIEEVRPELRDPIFEIKYRRYIQLKKQFSPPPATVLFMGSSMTVFGANAGAVDEPFSAVLGRPVVGFNLGVAGSGPFTQLVFLNRLLRRGAKPDLVVLELAPIFFAEADVYRELGHFPAQMLSRADLGVVERYSKNPDALRTEWWESFVAPVHGHRLTILNQAAGFLISNEDQLELWDDIDAHGWRRMPVPSPREQERVLKGVRKLFEGQLAAFQLGENPLRALRELIDLLAREGIPTVLVIMPEGPLMRSFYRPETIQPLMQEIAQMSLTHRFPLVDAQAWLGEDKFWDSFHLTEVGGHEFTERLLREFILPWVSTGPSSSSGRKR